MLRALTALRDFVAPIQTINEDAKTNILNRIVNKPLAMTISEINYDAARNLKTEITISEDTNRAKIINTLVEYISYTDTENTTFDNSRVLKFMMLFATTPEMSGELRTEDYKNLIRYAALCGNFEAIRIMSQLNAAQEPNGFEKVINDTELLRNLANEGHEHAVYTILRAGGFMLEAQDIQALKCNDDFKNRLAFLRNSKSLISLEAFQSYPACFNSKDRVILNDIWYFSRANCLESGSYYDSFYNTSFIQASKYGVIHESLLRTAVRSHDVGNIYDPKLIILNLQKIQEDIEALEDEQLGLYNTTLDQVASYVKFTARLITKQTKTFEQYNKEIEALQKISDDLSKFAFAHRDKNGAIYINEDWNTDINAISNALNLSQPKAIEEENDDYLLQSALGEEQEVDGVVIDPDYDLDDLLHSCLDNEDDEERAEVAQEPVEVEVVAPAAPEPSKRLEEKREDKDVLNGNIFSRNPLRTTAAALCLCTVAGIALASHRIGEGSIKTGFTELCKIVGDWLKHHMPTSVMDKFKPL